MKNCPNGRHWPFFSSDALSSVAYATEEILLVLALLGTSVFFYSLPIAVAILVLLLLVTLSYRQIIYAFPSGGGAYVVARDHLGTKISLVAGAALMIDFPASAKWSRNPFSTLAAFPMTLRHCRLFSTKKTNKSCGKSGRSFIRTFR
ncbi:hypothetical protein B1A75_09325 [Geobacillus sp. LEMMY01]|nr:hypothetical protein [Geobacillus sp. LEMMY01]OPX03240.1 hypothetical protein B1A75_09325 [Geobacillus sp. LEMMY01]